MKCPFCGNVNGVCPECGKTFELGKISHCPKPDCQEMNTPIDCSGCYRTVEHDCKGILDFDMSLKPWAI